jgi:hypothetical protein
VSRYSKTLTEVFEAYRDEAQAALAAYANVDPEGWSEYVDRSAAKCYLADYAHWRNSQVRRVEADAIAAANGQARLFEVEPGVAVDVRTVLVLGGVEYEVGSLVGATGAAILRAVAQRDLKPAVTTVKRCKNWFSLADHIVAESERLGRDVSVAEVLGWSEAA